MKYKFCEQLKKSIFFDSTSVVHCCNCSHEKDTTFLEEYNGEKIDWNALIKQKKDFQTTAANTGKIAYKTCEKCHMWREDEWDEDSYLNEIIINHWTSCNCNCFYCFTSEDKNFYNSFKNYDIYPVLKDLKKSGFLNFKKDNGGIVRFLGGDVSTLKDFDKIVKLFLDAGAKNIYIPTSGIKFLPIIEKVLKKGRGEVIISLDAGDRELFKKIKRIDAYDNVKKNIKKYALAAKKGKSLFKAKYIIIPFVNDSKEQIDKWLKECIDLGVENIAYDVEDNFVTKFHLQIPKNIPELLSYIENKALDEGLKTTRFRFASQMLYELELGTAKFAEQETCETEQKRYIDFLLNQGK